MAVSEKGVWTVLRPPRMRAYVLRIRDQAAERMASDRNRSRDGATRFGGVELAAAAVLGAGALAGLVLWAKWGFAIAFDALVTYCF